MTQDILSALEFIMYGTAQHKRTQIKWCMMKQDNVKDCVFNGIIKSLNQL